MKRNVSLLSMIILFLLVVNIDALFQNHPQSLESLSTFDISLQAVSYRVYNFDCSAGDTLSGFFKLTQDGDLFPGDQTKYDNWLLGGIDFLIMNEETFDVWSQSIPIDAQYVRTSITELTWSYDVSSTGRWYVVYINDSVYIKQIEGSISHTSASNTAIPMVLVSIVLILTLTSLYIVKRKNE